MGRFIWQVEFGVGVEGELLSQGGATKKHRAIKFVKVIKRKSI